MIDTISLHKNVFWGWTHPKFIMAKHHTILDVTESDIGNRRVESRHELASDVTLANVTPRLNERMG